jgi:gliding motility-associated lipoprotein GldD
MKIIRSIFLILFIPACTQNYIPKPAGYFRIDFPKKEYKTYLTSCPFTFESPVYASIQKSELPGAEPCWLNMDFPAFKAKIHLSYMDLHHNVHEILEECRTMAYKHAVKADAIDEQVYIDKEHEIYGMLYKIKGNAASSLQFYVSDSTTHFLRGALYFDVRPNKDSLAPVVAFLEKDIVKLMESVRWK